MNERDLVKKLENTGTPDIELPSHRQTLKTALLENMYTTENRNSSGRITDITNKLNSWLFSRQPVWKTATIGLGVVSIAIALSILLSIVHSDSVYAKAIDIIRNSREIQEMLDTSDNQSDFGNIIFPAESYTMEYNDNDTIIITFPDGNIQGVIGDSKIQIGKYSPDGKSLEFTPEDGIIRIMTDVDGDIRTIEVIFGSKNP